MFPFQPRQPQYFSTGYHPYTHNPHFNNYDPFFSLYGHLHPASTSNAYFEPEHDESVMDPDSYRRIALEHQRKAEAALALAQEQEMRNRELQRRLALDRLRNEFGGHQYRQVDDPRAGTSDRESSPPPQLHSRPHAPVVPSVRPEVLEGPRRGTLEDEIRGFLLRREREREHVSNLRAGNTVVIPVLDGSSTSTPHQPRPSVPLSVGNRGEAQPSVRLEHPVPVRPHNDMATKIREALSSGRSEEEKDRILEELGLVPPKPSVPPLSKQEREVASPTAQALKREQARPPVSPTPNSGAAGSSPTVATPKPTATTAHKVLSASLAIIDAIQTQLDTIRAEFVFPSTIEFNTALTTPDDTPGLLHNHTNAPVLHYESELIDLLTKLDAIESGGSESVRGARKALVLAVEEALDALGEMKAEAWRKIRAKEECAPESCEKDGDQAHPEESITVDMPLVQETLENVLKEEVAAPASEGLTDDKVGAEPPAAEDAGTIELTIPTEQTLEKPQSSEEPSEPEKHANTAELAPALTKPEVPQPPSTAEPLEDDSGPTDAVENSSTAVPDMPTEPIAQPTEAGADQTSPSPHKEKNHNWVRVEVQ
ncbi:hypothetical protein FRB93_013998 [Tulasnella sp. JGI-2019a]|nr:hypothetical protein FRB93_013998 [Tulasnella sp. JGI-2019a]